MVIINGIIHPVGGAVIQSGFVAWEGGRITAVGEMARLPQGDLGEVIDARGGHVTPGYIDAHCHLGVFGDSLGFEGEDGNECTDPITPISGRWTPSTRRTVALQRHGRPE